MDSDLTLIIIIGLLIIGSAYFSATETAFSSLNRIKLKNLAQNGNKRAADTLILCEKYDKLLTSILIGNNIVNILSSSLATTLFMFYFPKNGVAVSTIVMTVLVLIFGEICPKSIAKEVPERFAMFSTPLIRIIIWILTPLCVFFTAIKNIFAKLFKIHSDSSITDDEILTMVEEATNEGSIDEDEGDLIKNAIGFYELEVGEILTPRVDVVAVEINDSREKIKSSFENSGFSRLPVYEDTIDSIIGFITHKDYQQRVIGVGLPLSTVIKPVAFVVPGMKVSVLLELLKSKKSHIAVVTDEYGGTVGIVTLEDILEELVGEIWDEHDTVMEEFTVFSEKCVRVRATANCEKMFEMFGIKENTDSTTVGGWVMEKLGKVPAKGDSFLFDNLKITVTKIDDKRVLEIVVLINNDSQEHEEEN